MANSVDPDQTPRCAASDLGLHCLLRPACPNTLSKCGNLIKSNPLRNDPGSAPVSKTSMYNVSVFLQSKGGSSFTDEDTHSVHPDATVIYDRKALFR